MIKIKTAAGAVWLTVPVEVKGLYHQAIDETRVSDPAWADATVFRTHPFLDGPNHVEWLRQLVRGKDFRQALDPNQ